MSSNKIHFIDNVVDVGICLETRLKNYPIVKDYYDLKFHVPQKKYARFAPAAARRMWRAKNIMVCTASYMKVPMGTPTRRRMSR